MIADTSVILDIIDDVEAAVEKEQELEATNVPLVIPSMAVLELYIDGGKSRIQLNNARRSKLRLIHIRWSI